ncbi:MAG: copper homeostasis protein CutC [Flavisolibacter sp.]|nr:copper homeostasis protein CutC [Flavisolibacter sp.]
MRHDLITKQTLQSHILYLSSHPLTYQLINLSTTQPVNYIIEIATADFITTQSAVQGGADRIELCAALTEGGTTPSYGTIKKCREVFAIELFPIVRPRGGDFLYTDEEYEIILQDVRLCKDLGCDGVVIGMLKRDGTLPVRKTAKLIAEAYPMDVTFHRAFDRCAEPFEAMEQLIQIGCTRILTSGQQPAAPQGIDLIANLIKAANARIVIMPGSGVRKENIKEIAQRTGAVEFHSSLRSKQRSGMEFIHPAFEKSEESYSNAAIDVEEVKAMRSALH